VNTLCLFSVCLRAAISFRVLISVELAVTITNPKEKEIMKIKLFSV
jgi:hypothetical protein